MKLNFKKAGARILLVVFFSSLLIISCEKDDEFVQPDAKTKNQEFFKHQKTGGDEFKTYILECLAQADDSLSFTGDFVKTYGFPQWDCGMSFNVEDRNSLIIPILDKTNKSISALYYLKYSGNDIETYLFMNDHDDAAYSYLSRMIQYFEKIMNLKISNDDIIVTIKGSDGTKKTKARSEIMETCYSWEQLWIDSNGKSHYDPYKECFIHIEVRSDFHTSRGDWNLNSSGNYKPNDSYNGGSGNGNGEPEPRDPLPVPPVKTTQEFLDNEKLNCIWGKLNNIVVNQNNSLITSIFANFSGLAYNPQDINIEIATNLLTKDGGVANGTTEWENGNFTIKINKDNLDSKAPIEIFRTIIHEMIHAHLWRLQYVNTDSFISRYRKYIEFKDGVCVTDQHILMKDYYIPMLSNALKAYDTLNGRTLDSSYYTNLAWAGLHMSLPLSERVKIANTIVFFRNRNLICDE